MGKIDPLNINDGDSFPSYDMLVKYFLSYIFLMMKAY